MAELITNTPCGTLLPIQMGQITLSELDPGHMTSLCAYNGRDTALSNALKEAHGMAAPGPGKTTGKAGARAVWFGQGTILLMGPAPASDLREHAALTDQSDAWAVVNLEGEGVVDVLARLTPLDLRTAQFRRGRTARTEVAHMAASVTRIGNNRYQIMVFRSFARSLVHEISVAMESIAARSPR